MLAEEACSQSGHSLEACSTLKTISNPSMPWPSHTYRTKESSWQCTHLPDGENKGPGRQQLPEPPRQLVTREPGPVRLAASPPPNALSASWSPALSLDTHLWPRAGAHFGPMILLALDLSRLEVNPNHQVALQSRGHRLTGTSPAGERSPNKFLR